MRKPNGKGYTEITRVISGIDSTEDYLCRR